MKWENVPGIDLSTLSVDDFSDDDIYPIYSQQSSACHSMPYYLANFHLLANSVREDGPLRGYMDAVVWRAPVYNQPHNARIMESHLSLAYFYCTEKPYNIYFGMEAVKIRLEAMLLYLAGIQLENGMFTEFGVAQPNLAATAFATKFLGETLRLLKNGPPINSDILEKTITAYRKAVIITLTDPTFLKLGRFFSNQYTNIWPGALAYISLYPDDEIRQLLLSSMRDAIGGELQSEAGFFYEHDQPDWGYTLGTHNNNERGAWHYARGTEFEGFIVQGSQAFYDWLSYNLVLEPDERSYITNCCIESRQRMNALRACRETELAEVVSAARAFMLDTEEKSRECAERRQKQRESWPNVGVADLTMDGSFTPYAFLLEGVRKWNPTPEEKAMAVSALPYISSRYFNHQRMDWRTQLINLYIRRPSYYCAFNVGDSKIPQQRFGLGFVWTEESGVFMQSQSGSDTTAWGSEQANGLLEKAITPSTTLFNVNGRVAAPVIGKSNWEDGDVSVTYTSIEGGCKKVTFTDDAICVENYFAGPKTEIIPLTIADGDKIELSGVSVIIRRENTTFEITFGADDAIILSPTKMKTGRYTLVPLRISSDSNIQYTIRLY